MRHRPLRHPGAVAALLLYIALALCFFGESRDWTRHYFGVNSDPITFIWFLNWWPFAITHGLNPFICKYVWYPAGFNMTWAASVPLLALIGWPVTAWGGPVLTYNLLMVSAPAFAAWTAWLLCRELTEDGAASLAGGFLFGFSATEYWELQSELNCSVVCLIPLAVFLCVRRMRGRLGRRAFILSLAALLVAQLGISTEYLATLCVLGALAWAVCLAFAPAADRFRLLLLAIDIWLAAGLAVIAALPFFVTLLRGLADVPPVINSPVFASADLVAFLSPVLPVPNAGTLLAAIGRQFAGFSPDRSFSIGLPLLIILTLYFIANRRRPYARGLAGIFVLISVASLGPVLHWNGVLRRVTLPWALATHVPLIRSVLPARFMCYVTLCTSVITALWLAQPGTWRLCCLRYGVAVAAVLCLIPGRPVVVAPPWQIKPMFAPQTHFYWTPIPESAFFNPQNITQKLGKMANVILLPGPDFGGTMAYQLQSGMRFTQSRGYVGFEPVPERRYSVLDSLDFGNLAPNFGNDFSAYCASHHVGYILMAPGTPPSLIPAIAALGWPEYTDSGIIVVKTPYGLAASP